MAVPFEISEKPSLGRSVRDNDVVLVSATDEGNVLRSVAPPLLRARARWKDPVRVVDTAGLSPTTDYENGDSVGGATLATGDELLRATPGGHADDGFYVASASGAASRRVDAPSGGTTELTAGAAVYVQEGAYSGRIFQLRTTGTITIGTTAQRWALLQPIEPEPTTVQAPSSALFSTGNWQYPWRNSARSTFSHVAQREYWVPVEWVHDSGLIGLGLQVSTAVGSSSAVLAVYERDRDLTIGGRIVRTASLNTASTGAVVETFASLGMFYGRRLWLGVYSDAAIGYYAPNYERSWHVNSGGQTTNIYARGGISLANAFPVSPPALSTLSATLWLAGFAPAPILKIG